MSEKTFFEEYFEHCDYTANNYTADTTKPRLETRTRQYDVTDALRFRVHDPLWMLSRQWQMGEFRGNDAGTAMSVRATVNYTPIAKYQLGKDGGRTVSASADTPIEPLVEQIDREITPLVRVESAVYFLDLLQDDPSVQDVKKLAGKLVENSLLKLDASAFSMERSSIPDTGGRVKAFTDSRNTRLLRFKAAYAGNIFDGYKLYQCLKNKTDLKLPAGLAIPAGVSTAYCKWFGERYLPNSSKKSAWDPRSLGHQFKAEHPFGVYTAEDYAGGRVSWYSFDLEKTQNKTSTATKVRVIDSLPTLASYPGSPNKRLWQFEDQKVFMGNSTGMQAKGNIAFLQYATMYANDWMLFPLKTEVGQYVEVKSIEVYDSFGLRVDQVGPVRKLFRAGKNDPKPSTFGQRWEMFTNAPIQQESPTAESAEGLLFPPALARTLEGEPIEEVNILRDEMANMVWGVETRIDDCCGSHLDASLLASEVEQFVEDTYQKDVETARLSVRHDEEGDTVVQTGYNAEYKYTLMTGVPLNWIPFVPQHIKSDAEKRRFKGLLGGREVVFRRGKMPCFFDKDYYPVRPMSSILKVETSQTSGNAVAETPLFLDEEQVQGVGTLIVKNCQRSRWIGGKTYTWMGYSKQIKNTQGVSGLEYDTLRDVSE